MKPTTFKITSTACTLRDLGLPYLQVILEEIFLLPPAFLGEPPLGEDASIADLIAFTGIKEDEVIRSLRQLIKWSGEILISPAEYASLLEKGSSQLLHLDADDEMVAKNFYALSEEVKASGKTLIISSKDPARAFSAALYCRQQGLRCVSRMGPGHST